MTVFTALVLLAQVLGLTAVILTGVWMGKFQGGFAWTENPIVEFNYHPLFLIIGLVFIYGDAIMVYRVFRNEKKTYIKLLHVVMHIVVIIFVAFGLKAVFDSNNLLTPPTPNLFSLHSWLGIITVTLFALQFVVGFFSFMLPMSPIGWRNTYKPNHAYWGITIFVLAIATCLTGIMEKTLFSVGDYNNFTPQTYVINFLGIALVSFGAVVVFIVSNSAYARQPLPEEEQHLPLDN